jgi:hypothetical protein
VAVHEIHFQSLIRGTKRMTDIVEELNIAARKEDASEKVLSLLAEAAGTIDRYRMWLREANKPVATVTNNNQPGTSHIVETAPNVTLDVGTKLYMAPRSPQETAHD